jgi:hypothetical protein
MTGFLSVVLRCAGQTNASASCVANVIHARHMYPEQVFVLRRGDNDVASDLNVGDHLLSSPISSPHAKDFDERPNRFNQMNIA